MAAACWQSARLLVVESFAGAGPLCSGAGDGAGAGNGAGDDAGDDAGADAGDEGQDTSNLVEDAPQ